MSGDVKRRETGYLESGALGSHSARALSPKVLRQLSEVVTHTAQTVPEHQRAIKRITQEGALQTQERFARLAEGFASTRRANERDGNSAGPRAFKRSKNQSTERLRRALTEHSQAEQQPVQSPFPRDTHATESQRSEENYTSQVLDIRGVQVHDRPHAPSYPGGPSGYDLLIKGGTVIDGSGRPGYRADVGVREGKIADIGPNLPEGAAHTLDASGKVVSPGFFDTHTHDDRAVVRGEPVPGNPSPEGSVMEPKVQQGVTTLVTGNCGFSMAPCRPEHEEQLRSAATPVLGVDRLPWAWRSFDEWANNVRSLQLGQNVTALVGHNAIRAYAMGWENRKPTTQELKTQQAVIRDAMQAGAAGISLGLLYPPSQFAKAKELTALAHTVSDHGGVLAAHIRNQSDKLVPTVDEMLKIAERTGVGLHISHLFAAGPENWRQMDQILTRIEGARHKGLNVTADVYPYTAAGTLMTSFLPPWAAKGGIDDIMVRLDNPATRAQILKDVDSDPAKRRRKEIRNWENLLHADHPENTYLLFIPQEHLKHLQGMNMVQAAEQLHMEISEALCYLMAETRAGITIRSECMDPNDLAQVMAAPFVMIGSDGLPTDAEVPHPRLYGTVPEAIRLFREAGLPLEEGIRKMTSLPAKRFGLDRGLIEVNRPADITIFDPVTLKSNATYEDSRHYPQGISAVIVNGQLVLENGVLQAARPGQLLSPSRGSIGPK